MERENMDGGSLRGQRSNDGRITTKQEQPIQRQAPVATIEPRTTSHSPKKAEKKSSRKNLLFFVIIVAAIIVLGGAYFYFSKNQGVTAGIDSSKYQAVFLSNGQVYFGKLQGFNNESMKLTDIYYLQGDQSATGTEDSKNPQETDNNSTNVQLIKLGKEIHGPVDEMILLKNQVLFYENLKSDGKVVQTIQKSKDGGDF